MRTIIKRGASKRKFTILSLVLVMIYLWAVQFYRTQELNMNDENYAHINQELMKLRLENMHLKREILTGESLMVISSKAAQMGFIPGKSVFIVPK